MSQKKERSDKRVKSSISRNETVDIRDMTRKQFENMPYRGAWDKEVVCTCVVILPSRKIHDSGYRCIDFVAIKKGKLLCRLSGCSDIIHIEGIGGRGQRKLGVPFSYSDLVERKPWSMDCLKKSGLLRMWVDGCNLVCGPSLSSFEIWSVKIKKENR